MRLLVIAFPMLIAAFPQTASSVSRLPETAAAPEREPQRSARAEPAEPTGPG